MLRGEGKFLVTVILTLLMLYVIGKIDFEGPKEKLKTIGNAPERSISYDFNNQEWRYPSGTTDTPRIRYKEKEKVTEVIRFEQHRYIKEETFEKRIEDYIEDNWDDIRDKYNN